MALQVGLPSKAIDMGYAQTDQNGNPTPFNYLGSIPSMGHAANTSQGQFSAAQLASMTPEERSAATGGAVKYMPDVGTAGPDWWAAQGAGSGAAGAEAAQARQVANGAVGGSGALGAGGSSSSSSATIGGVGGGLGGSVAIPAFNSAKWAQELADAKAEIGIQQSADDDQMDLEGVGNFGGVKASDHAEFAKQRSQAAARIAGEEGAAENNYNLTAADIRLRDLTQQRQYSRDAQAYADSLANSLRGYSQPNQHPEASSGSGSGSGSAGSSSLSSSSGTMSGLPSRGGTAPGAPPVNTQDPTLDIHDILSAMNSDTGRAKMGGWTYQQALDAYRFWVTNPVNEGTPQSLQALQTHPDWV